MKKLFYCACVAALATACTNEELVSENTGAEVSRGITFEATIEGSAADSRGEMTNDYHFFWYAEQDRINVYADKVVADPANTNENGVVTYWNDVASVTPAVYKATKSASQGQFTSKDDANLISFAGNQYAYFVALYPETTTLDALVDTTDVKKNDVHQYTTNVDYKVAVAESNANQVVALNQVAAPMYSKNYGKRSASYESVGEKMALSFKRLFPVLRFTSATNNSDVNSVIGKLASVSITTKGAPVDADGYSLASTQIAAASSVYSIDALKTVDGWVNCNVPTLTTPVSTATTTLTTPSTWGAGDNVYMSIYPVKREGSKTGTTVKKQMTEKYDVTYNYQNVTLTKELSTAANWNIENAVYQIPTLDIANDFPWIVTNVGKTLVVFKGNFSDIYKANTNQSQIVWKSATNGYVLPSEITSIISYVELTDTELQSLKSKYTNLTKLTLHANTSLPANVFNSALATQLTDLNMPLVTEINNTNFPAFTSLKNLNLKSYAFAEDVLYAKFFNSNVMNSLETLNIEAVTSLRPTFGYDRTIVFTNYANLKTVALNPNGVALTSSAFKNCTNLQKVTGKVDIANAPDAFNGASTNADATKLTINVINTIIPNGAFRNANIKTIKLGNSQVAPTEIGEYAFDNNDAIELMDLSQATKIAKYAFNNASNFVGTGSVNRNVINVVATTINERIFAGTKVVRVQFANATTIGRDLFNGCTNTLKQVKFLKKVTGKIDYDPTAAVDYGYAFNGVTTTNLDLFVATSQSDVNGLVWNFTGNTFKSITKEDIAWGE